MSSSPTGRRQKGSAHRLVNVLSLGTSDDLVIAWTNAVSKCPLIILITAYINAEALHPSEEEVQTSSPQPEVNGEAGIVRQRRDVGPERGQGKAELFSESV